MGLACSPALPTLPTPSTPLLASLPASAQTPGPLLLPLCGKGRWQRALPRGNGQSLLWHLSAGHPMFRLRRAIKTMWSNANIGGQTEAQRGTGIQNEAKNLI